MKTSALHLGILLSLFICCKHVTHGNSAEETCELSIQNNKTFFQRLLNYYDMDGRIIIVEYTLKFNIVSDNFNLSTQSSPDSYQPWKWYSTQGIGSPRLLLIYDFMNGVMGYLLSFCTAEEELHLNVYPPDCLDKFENETLEEFLRKFMLKELNIGNTKVKDLYICTTQLHVKNEFSRIITYRCCTIEPFGDSNCIDVVEDDKVHYLFIFICVITALSVLLLPIVFQSEYRLEIYEFTLPTNIKASIKVPKKKLKPITIEINDEKHEISFSLVKKMGNFKIIPSDRSIRARLTKILVEVPLNKIFFCDKIQVSFLNIVCHMISECQRLCNDVFSGRCKKTSPCANCIKRPNGKSLFIMICLFLLSLPILVLLCFDDSRLQDIRKESVKQVYEPFEHFMKMLINTNLCKDLAIDRRALNNPPENIVLDELDEPLFLTEERELWVKLSHPFIDVYEKKISQSFLFRCASVDHSEAPGTFVYNFFKAMKKIFQIAVFIIFIYMAVTAYGHTSYISLSNLSFTTFITALLPIIISNFLMTSTDKRESTVESKKLLMNKIKTQIKDFSESWVVYDLVFEEIPNNGDNISQPLQPGATGNIHNENVLKELDHSRDGKVRTEIGIWRLAEGDMSAKKCCSGALRIHNCCTSVV